VHVKLQTIIDAMPAIGLFAQKELPAKAAYRIAKLVRKLTSEYREFEAARNKAVLKYGTKVMKKLPGQKEEREVTEVTPENIEAFNAEIKALLESEVELTGVAKIAFEDLAHLELSPAVLSDLDFIIDEPVEDKKAA
jgi:hypothetical protein